MTADHCSQIGISHSDETLHIIVTNARKYDRLASWWMVSSGWLTVSEKNVWREKKDALIHACKKLALAIRWLSQMISLNLAQ